MQILFIMGGKNLFTLYLKQNILQYMHQYSNGEYYSTFVKILEYSCESTGVLSHKYCLKKSKS